MALQRARYPGAVHACRVRCLHHWPSEHARHTQFDLPNARCPQEVHNYCLAICAVFFQVHVHVSLQVKQSPSWAAQTPRIHKA
jgi:hypothetical protein